MSERDDADVLERVPRQFSFPAVPGLSARPRSPPDDQAHRSGWGPGAGRGYSPLMGGEGRWA